MSRLTALLSHIDAASTAHPLLPLVIVGDFNCRHADWYCPKAILHPTSVTPSANHLASWIENSSLDVYNPVGQPTRLPYDNSPSGSVIDLVLCDNPALVASVEQAPLSLTTDHYPFTITLALTTTAPAPSPSHHRPRVTWDHHHDPSVWQSVLPHAMEDALSPLQPLLSSLTQPILPTTSAQSLLDDVYSQVEQALLLTCHSMVGTKEVRPTSNPWMRYPGIHECHTERADASAAYWAHPNSAALTRLRLARRAWADLSAQAKQESFAELCEQIVQPDDQLKWKLFKRTAPSTFTSLAAITHPDTKQLPSDHPSSLDNLCTAFLRNGVPPPPSNLAPLLRPRHEGRGLGHFLPPLYPPTRQ